MISEHVETHVWKLSEVIDNKLIFPNASFHVIVSQMVDDGGRYSSSVHGSSEQS